MGFSLGEPERIYNMCLKYHARLKNYVDFVTYPEALRNVETLPLMGFSLGEPERIYNFCL